MSYTLVNPYCTVTEVIEELKWPAADVPSGSAKEDEVKRAIYNASRWIDAYQRRDYFYHNHLVTGLTFDARSAVYGDTIFLPHTPVISVSSVGLGSEILSASTDYSVGADLDRVYRVGGDWSPSYPDNLVTIKGAFGYYQAVNTDVPTGIPGHISHAARIIAAVFSGHNRKEVAGLDGQKQEILTNTIPKSVYDILGRRGPILV